MKENIAAEQIRNFLTHQFPLTKSVSNEDALLDGGLIDSLGILEVVSFLENEFKISVCDEDLIPENFGSVRNLAQFVTYKQADPK